LGHPGEDQSRGTGRSARASSERAARAKAIDAKDKANRRPVGTNQYNEGVRDVQDVTNTLKTQTDDAAYAMARLRRDAPAIHARVLAGELTAHAGMVEAGEAFQAPLDRPRTLAGGSLARFSGRGAPEGRVKRSSLREKLRGRVPGVRSSGAVVYA
jgi:hypothetical protein